MTVLLLDVIKKGVPMSEKIVKILNFLVLLAGCAILGMAANANPKLFDPTPHFIIKIWVGLIIFYFILSGTYKLLITFNRFYAILGLGSLVILMLILLLLFAPLFTTIPKDGDSTGAVWVGLTLAGWTLWDVFMLTINAHAFYSSNEDDSNQR